MSKTDRLVRWLLMGVAAIVIIVVTGLSLAKDDVCGALNQTRVDLVADAREEIIYYERYREIVVNRGVPGDRAILANVDTLINQKRNLVKEYTEKVC